MTRLPCDGRGAETVDGPVDLNFDLRDGSAGAGAAFAVAPKLNVIEASSAEVNCTSSYSSSAAPSSLSSFSESVGPRSTSSKREPSFAMRTRVDEVG